ncbi:MAG: tetratricopeptide repeat protein [Candidatus Kapabacteria bacterium]|nr:tetratricopeptide repeat protein [Candidatus Kapabacteria bacterium]
MKRRMLDLTNPLPAWSLMFAVATLMLIGVHNATAQDERERVASAYEQSGDYRSSARIWMELLQANPGNTRAFEGTVRSLKALQNFSSLIDIVEQQLKRNRSAKILALYGQVLFKSGKTKEAEQAWNDALSIRPATMAAIKEVVLSQVEIRQSDLAIASILRGREQLDSPSIFADELAQLYAATGNYKQGIQEVLTSFAQTRNMQSTQGRISAFLTNDSATAYITTYMQNVSASKRNDNSYLKLYAWFLRERKDYLAAFETTTDIDNNTRANGSEVFTFAEQCRFENQYEAALKAYTWIIDKGTSNPYAQNAYYGYARTLESRLASLNSQGLKISTEEVKAIIERYRALEVAYPNTNIAAEAKYHIGVLQQDQLNRLDDANTEYTSLVKQYRNYPAAAYAMLNMGIIAVMQDRFADATSCYKQCNDEFVNRVPQLRDETTFRSAELSFYAGSFDEAMRLYEQLSGNTESEFANDAIERTTLISLNKEDSVLLRQYAQAELRAYQRRYTEAHQLYNQIAQSKSSPDLAETAMMNSARAYFDAKDFAQCRSVLQTLRTKNAQTIFGDKAMLLSSQCHINEGNKQAAIQELQELLVMYPRSIYLQEARERIRKLRGDA